NLALAGYGGGVRQTGGTLFMENNDLGANKAVKKGGGVWTSASDAIVVDTVFSGNTALGGGGMSFFGGTLLHKRGSFDTNIADFGGGLEIGFAASSAFIVDTTFRANQAQVNNGAALWVDGTDLELEGITFADNVAVHLGGGLYQWREGSLTVRTSTFSDNQARAGGAISYDSRNVGTLASDVSIEDSLFERNLANPSMAAVAEGGALQIARARNLDVRRSLFLDNLAMAGSTQRGGTLRLVYNDHTTVEDSFLCGSSAANGGAVHTDRSGVQDSWHNNIFVNNSATTHGAAVVFNEPAGVDFTHNTVVNNDGDRTAALLFTLASGASANTDNNVVAYSDASAILPGVGAIGAWDATTESIVDSGWGTNYCHANQPDDFTSIFTGPPSCTDPGTDPLPGSDPDPMDCDSFGQSDFVLDSAFAGAGADPTNIPLP
ncbi:MAG: right-handed parallel beta-helix repeat-containing protein, partial [Myxococcales bacterium]|nr:right-handed parallel beta-helix repeat-containing protein [Myxococcales bacterium]